MLRFLVDAGADVNRVYYNYDARRDISCLDVVETRAAAELLVDVGADVRVGFPLHRFEELDDYGVMDVLVAAGADVDREDWFGHTPLQFAINKMRSFPVHAAWAEQSISKLLELGANPNIAFSGM